jgi:hypothetical protein
MRHLFSILVIAVFLFLPGLKAQDYKKLSELKGHKVKVFYSQGYEKRASTITDKVDMAMSYYLQLLDMRPEVTLLILSESDWPTYTDMPVIGMPHYKNNKELVVIAHDNAFWKSYTPPLDKLPKTLADQIRAAYTNPEGNISMQPFFDLLAIHELGHAFHLQAGLNMQRKWMQELFVNILLHTFVAEKEPQSLPPLTVFPQMVIGGGTADYLYTSLKDIDEKYQEIGSKHPRNYGWYQCRWHAASAKIYDAGGMRAATLLWKTLKDQKQRLPENELIPFFEKAGLRSVAEMIRNWDKQ